MNCFLAKAGKNHVICSSHDVTACTAQLDMATFQIFNDYFIHTHNMCAFLQLQVWNEQTDATMNRLASTSHNVAQQLTESSQITAEMLKQQNSSLENQERILKSGLQLSAAIATSSDNLHQMFDNYKQTTKQQQMMIGEVFEKITNLQSTVLGEFAGFYSMVFHTLSIILCYLLTSTPRTNGARFWLFTLMVMNILVERVIVWWYSWYYHGGATSNMEVNTYYNRLRI